MKKLGARVEKFHRVEQDGVRNQIGNFIAACLADAAGRGNIAKEACISAAKNKYKELTGKAGASADAKFERVQRKAAGRIAAASKKACLKVENLDKTGVDACDKAAKASHTNAGGNEKGYWYDAKRGLLRDALDYYEACLEKEVETEGTCTTKAKTFFVTTLKGDTGDWNEADFTESKANRDLQVDEIPSQKVDMRFRFKPNMAERISSKEAVTSSLTAIENALKEKAAAVTVKCNDATSPGANIDVACRIVVSNSIAAALLETAVRAGDVDSYANVAAAAVTSVVTVRGRQLSAVESTTDVNQVQSEVAEDSTQATPDPTKAPTVSSILPLVNSSSNVILSSAAFFVILTSLFVSI
jgi:hypothetical protein